MPPPGGWLPPLHESGGLYTDLRLGCLCLQRASPCVGTYCCKIGCFQRLGFIFTEQEAFGGDLLQRLLFTIKKVNICHLRKLKDIKKHILLKKKSLKKSDCSLRTAAESAPCPAGLGGRLANCVLTHCVIYKGISEEHRSVARLSAAFHAWHFHVVCFPARAKYLFLFSPLLNAF